MQLCQGTILFNANRRLMTGALACKNPSHLLILLQTACIESSLSSHLLAHFRMMKISAKKMRKPSSEPIWETSNRPPNIKCIVPTFFIETGLVKRRQFANLQAVLPRIRR
jgi:hypothetical protein